MLAGGDGFTKKSLAAMVCHSCGANRETVLRKFGAQEVALEGIKGHVRLTGVFGDIPADRRVPHFRAHGVMRIAIARVNGIVRVLVTHGGVSRRSAASMVHGVLNGARKVARTVRPGKWRAHKANAKGQVRGELGAAAHFVEARLCGPLLQLGALVIKNHQVGGMPRVHVCTEWSEAFAAMAEVAWKEDFLSGAEQRALLQRHLWVSTVSKLTPPLFLSSRFSRTWLPSNAKQLNFAMAPHRATYAYMWSIHMCIHKIFPHPRSR